MSVENQGMNSGERKLELISKAETAPFSVESRGQIEEIARELGIEIRIKKVDRQLMRGPFNNASTREVGPFLVVKVESLSREKWDEFCLRIKDFQDKEGAQEQLPAD